MTLDIAQLIGLGIFVLLLLAGYSIAASVRRLNYKMDILDSSLFEIQKSLSAIRNSLTKTN